MKITIIHGQDHEGSTCMVARELAEKVSGTGAELAASDEVKKAYLGG